jgi:7-cyano-7-deazaguanine synthase
VTSAGRGTQDAGTKTAIVLLSGGLDSTTTLALAQEAGFKCYALSFDYGQRHRVELQAARRVARKMGAAEHVIMKMDLCVFGGSALTSGQAVPKDRPVEEIGRGIAVTYVPARNTIFLSFALAYAEVQGCRDIFIGVNALDYSGYPDCRPEYIAAFERMARLATQAAVEKGMRVRIHTPLIAMTKAQIVSTAARLGVDFSLTHSCYDPPRRGWACGRCDACLLRKKGFEEAGVEDAIHYLK